MVALGVGTRALQLQIEHVTLRIRPFVGSGAARRRLHRGVHGDAAEKRAVSSLPVMTGIFGDGAGVGVFSGTSISIGVSGANWVRCHCSSEIQRRHDRRQHSREKKQEHKKRERPEPEFSHADRLFFDPGDDRDDDADHAQDRHQPGRHHFAAFHETPE